jgi:hypothetical protein
MISVLEGVAYGSSSDRWDEPGHQIEKECGAFHQLALSTLPITLQDATLAKPSKAGEDARREARRLRNIGQNLSGITGPDEEMVVTMERAQSALLETYAMVRRTIAQVSNIQLSMPAVFPIFRRSMPA